MTSEIRITLRPKMISDAKDDYAWQTDTELVELDAAIPLDISFKEYLSEYTFELCYPSLNRHEFGIDTLDGKHIGNCVYYNVNTAESKVELGIMIGDREYWNKGYGVEAINALLDIIFNRTSLERVYLNTLNWNTRAQKCFKKCGFVESSKVERDGSVFLLMLIHRHEWEDLRSQNSPQKTDIAASE